MYIYKEVSKLKKIKPLVFIVIILAFIMILLFFRTAYGNMTVQGNQSAESKTEMGDEKMSGEVPGGSTGTESSESAEEKVAAVDKKMNDVLAGDEYNEMSLPERKELASDLLSQLERDGYITGLLYDDDSFTYSFEYADGTLGGWRIKDFSDQDDLLPMN